VDEPRSCRDFGVFRALVAHDFGFGVACGGSCGSNSTRRFPFFENFRSGGVGGGAGLCGGINEMVG
jgi:hypothetical protein